MRVTLLQAIAFFLLSLSVWIFIEYLFYRVQRKDQSALLDKSLKPYENKPIQ